MDTKKEFREIQKKEVPFSNFIDFLHACVGDDRFKSRFEFVNSTKTKVSIVGICLKEFFSQIQLYQKEVEILKTDGYVDGLQHLTLIVKYETFLNSIYSLMENIAQIIFSLYPKKSLPRMFHEQKDRILKDSTIDTGYSKILEKLEWYDEVRSMRSEFTHFLTGMLVSFEDDIPGYINKPKSQRKDTLEKIEIKNVIQHAQYIYDNLVKFLEAFGKHFIDLINRDVRVLEICGLTQDFFVGTKLISYNEKKDGKAGICQTFKLDCPKANDCEARKNTDLETGQERNTI